MTRSEVLDAASKFNSIKCQPKLPYFKHLDGTRIEGEGIAAMLGVKPWLGSDALSSRLKTLKSPRILHIATHGFFLPITPQEHLGFSDDTDISDTHKLFGGQMIDNPMLRSGLAFAGVNGWMYNIPIPKEAEDGIITAEDNSGLNLLDTELVVLSACETGLGDVLVGEGVLGMRRSFVVSGVKTLIMSLWGVPDEETKELMVEFYKKLLAGLPKSESLREAQLIIKKKKQLPYYWGGFICQGDTRPIIS